MTVDDGDVAALEARTRDLLLSDRLTRPTREVLLRRLDRRFGPPTALSVSQMRTLDAVCLRLIPEPQLVQRVALSNAFEAWLKGGGARGWRHQKALPDLQLHRCGLDALDQQSAGRRGCVFTDLLPADQDALLQAASEGSAPAPAGFDPAIWFTELLTILTEIFYAHPLVQVAIGYDGMADAQTPLAVGLQAVAEEARTHGR